MTQAASDFLKEARSVWDSMDQWEETAEYGLSHIDAGVLAEYCEATGDDYARAAAEVVAFAREKVERESRHAVR